MSYSTWGGLFPTKKPRKARRKIKKLYDKAKMDIKVNELIRTAGEFNTRTWRLRPVTDEDVARDALAGRPVKVVKIEYGYPPARMYFIREEDVLLNTLVSAWMEAKRHIASFCLGRIPPALLQEIKQRRRALTPKDYEFYDF